MSDAMEPLEKDRVPRRFTAAGLKARSREAVPLVRVLDTFAVGSRHRADREWVVGLDALGELMVFPLSEAELMSGACKDLAYHDALTNKPPRRYELDAIYVMTVETVEHVESESSRRDAVYLYGRMRGPLPDASCESGVDGMLTVCRAEILQALAWARTTPFHCAPADGAQDARCSQLALPGEGARTLAQGRGLVLAYPVFPAEVSFDDPSNDLLMSHIAHDSLRSLQRELASSGSRDPFVEQTLPVPSRAKVVSELRAQGFEIDEDRATKKNDASGVTGWLSNVFGVGVTNVDVPPEASLDEYLDLAARGLELVADWPSEEAQIIATRTGVAAARQSAPAPTTRSVRVAPSRPKTTPTWTDAFVREHRGAGVATQVMSSRAVATDRATWSNDFETRRARARTAATKDESRPAKPTAQVDERGWQSDFEDAAAQPPASDDASSSSDWSDDFG